MYTSSLLAEQALPARRLLSSVELGWTALLAKLYAEPIEAEFTTRASSDYLVVMQLAGTCTMELQRPGGWVSAQYRPGTIGLTPPGGTATLRWRGVTASRHETLQVHLASDVVSRVRSELGRRASAGGIRDALTIDDPVLRSLCSAIHTALVWKSDPLVGDSLALGLTAHLLTGGPPAQSDTPDPSATRGTTGFGAVVEYMRAHLAEPVLLNDLATVAHMSPFHFLRAFRAAMGSTPHRYLVEMRMQRPPSCCVMAAFRSRKSCSPAGMRVRVTSPLSFEGVSGGRRSSSTRRTGRDIRTAVRSVQQCHPHSSACTVEVGVVPRFELELGITPTGGRDITVNAVAPGPTATPLFLEGKPQEVVSHIASLNPLERLGKAEDIAETVAFLAGPGRSVNGQVLYVNGGAA